LPVLGTRQQFNILAMFYCN